MNTLQSQPNESAYDGYARRITARLDDSTGDLHHDISERLRAARMQALAQRKKTIPVHETAPAVVQVGSSAALGWRGAGGGWWQSLLAAVPAMALMVGLVAINLSQDEYSTAEVAEVDAALLTDDLPPAAYADPGFVQFLKVGGTQNY